MTVFSISGLSSGLDTSSIVTQLMTVAAGPQTQLKTQLSTTQQQQAAYQAINSSMAALKTAADKLALTDTWNATAATSSDSSVTATGSSTAIAGTSTTFTVSTLAAAQISAAAISDPANAAVAANGLDLTIGTANPDGSVTGKTTHLSLTGNSAADVASAINSAGLGVKASVITTSGGGTVLQLNGTTTGAASAFSISGLSSSVTTLAAAQDATVTVGDPSAGGYTLSSSTNTFSNAIPGVTFTVSKPNVTTTIGVATDTNALSSAVSGLVSAANSALSTIGQATAQGAILAGDSTVTGLTQKILGIVSAGTGSQSFAGSGVDLTSAGTLTFDASTFATAFHTNPSGIQAMLQNSLATGLSSVSSAATDATNGSLTQLINADGTQITSLNKQISGWDTKLADQKTALEARFTAMETALSKLKSESSYLTSMFNGMTGSSSSSSSSGSSTLSTG